MKIPSGYRKIPYDLKNTSKIWAFQSVVGLAMFQNIFLDEMQVIKKKFTFFWKRNIWNIKLAKLTTQEAYTRFKINEFLRYTFSIFPQPVYCG